MSKIEEKFRFNPKQLEKFIQDVRNGVPDGQLQALATLLAVKDLKRYPKDVQDQIVERIARLTMQDNERKEPSTQISRQGGIFRFFQTEVRQTIFDHPKRQQELEELQEMLANGYNPVEHTDSTFRQRVKKDVSAGISNRFNRLFKRGK